MKIPRCNSPLLALLTVAACFGLAEPVRAQKSSHTSRPSPPRPAKPERSASAPKKSEGPKALSNPQGEKSPGARALAGQQQIEKLSTMTPEQRQNALASLPPDRQKHLEDALARWQKMTPEQQQNAKARVEKLQALPVDEQKQVRQAAQAFQQLPDDRKRTINREMNQLRKMTPQQRDARLADPEFKTKFSLAEQDIVKRRLEVLPEMDPIQD